MESKNKDRNIVAALSYSLFFITGVAVLWVEKEDKFIRFHAFQSVIIFGSLFVANILAGLLLSQLNFMGIFVGFISNLLSILLWLVWLIVWLVSMVKAYHGQIFKWPISGRYAEKLANDFSR